MMQLDQEKGQHRELLVPIYLYSQEGMCTFITQLLGSSPMLFSRLEIELDSALQLLLNAFEQLCPAQQHCHVGIMPTRMTHPRHLAPGSHHYLTFSLLYTISHPTVLMQTRPAVLLHPGRSTRPLGRHSNENRDNQTNSNGAWYGRAYPALLYHEGTSTVMYGHAQDDSSLRLAGQTGRTHMKGKPVASWMGKASSPALSPTTGSPFPIVATMPVRATGYLQQPG